MKAIFFLVAIALVVGIGLVLFADAGPRRVVRRRVVERPARVRRRRVETRQAVTQEVDDLGP